MSICVYTNCRVHTCVVTVLYTHIDTVYVHLYMQMLDDLSHTWCGIRIFRGVYCAVVYA